MTMGGSCGGPKTNANAQVLNVWGNVIPRLYVSGNTMANMAGGTYPGGGATIGPGLTFGYVSGKHVATLAPW
jgi:predicted oxidoreductase